MWAERGSCAQCKVWDRALCRSGAAIHRGVAVAAGAERPPAPSMGFQSPGLVQPTGQAPTYLPLCPLRHQRLPKASVVRHAPHNDGGGVPRLGILTSCPTVHCNTLIVRCKLGLADDFDARTPARHARPMGCAQCTARRHFSAAPQLLLRRPVVHGARSTMRPGQAQRASARA